MQLVAQGMLILNNTVIDMLRNIAIYEFTVDSDIKPRERDNRHRLRHRTAASAIAARPQCRRSNQ